MPEQPESCADCPHYRTDHYGPWCAYFNSGHLMVDPEDCECYHPKPD